VVIESKKNSSIFLRSVVLLVRSQITTGNSRSSLFFLSLQPFLLFAFLSPFHTIPHDPKHYANQHHIHQCKKRKSPSRIHRITHWNDRRTKHTSVTSPYTSCSATHLPPADIKHLAKLIAAVAAAGFSRCKSISNPFVILKAVLTPNPMTKSAISGPTMCV
jgi:hypothetical protein